MAKDDKTRYVTGGKRTGALVVWNEEPYDAAFKRLPGLTDAYAYLRVSGAAQVEGDGFPRQIDAIKRYAASHRIRIVKAFQEKGVSGAKDLRHRPALLEILTGPRPEGVKLVLVEKLDRLARDLMIQESIIADLRNHGFELVSVAEPDVCSDDPTRKLMRQMMGAFAEYEKGMIVLKLRAARQRKKAATGRCEGRKPYGGDPSRPEEANVVATIRRMKADGAKLPAIVKHLNETGAPTRAGGKWFANTVARITTR